MNYFQAAVCLENQAPQLQGGWRLRENTLSKLAFQTARPSGAREAWVLLALPLQSGVVGGGGRTSASSPVKRGESHSWFCAPYRHVEGTTWNNVHEENITGNLL